MKRIKVPDIKHPTLCYKQYNPTKPPFEGAMSRCMYPKGHSGPHQWEKRKDSK